MSFKLQRTCMGCNAKKNKSEFIRIVKNKENEIFIDRSFKMEGRGAYLCNNIKCLEKAVKAKRIEKVFNTKLSKEIYEKLKCLILEINNGGENIG